MKITEKIFNKESNEYVMKLNAPGRLINLWTTLDIYIQLTEEYVIEICKVIYNKSIHIDDYTLSMTAIELDNNIKLSIQWCIDELGDLNIDSIDIVSDKEFKLLVAESNQNNPSLN